ncbi:MAG: hypothetical protein ABFD79_15495 [Phycisphaerales bacterium]
MYYVVAYVHCSAAFPGDFREGEVKDMIVSGTNRAKAIGSDTMLKVNDAMRISI